MEQQREHDMRIGTLWDRNSRDPDMRLKPRQSHSGSDNASIVGALPTGEPGAEDAGGGLREGSPPRHQVEHDTCAPGACDNEELAVAERFLRMDQKYRVA
jgi:hypothetical protein